MLFTALSAQHQMASMSGLSHGSGLRTHNKALETDVCAAGCACSTNAAQLRRSTHHHGVSLPSMLTRSKGAPHVRNRVQDRS
jgi:hypothetical protein